MAKFKMEFEQTTLSKLGRTKAVAIKNRRESDALRRAVLNAGRVMRRQFERTVKTWDHRVTFQLKTRSRIGESTISYEISTTDRIWHFLDRGTNVRWVRPKSVAEGGLGFYLPKTSPDVFNSVQGAGEMTFVANTEDESPRPGIIKRGWSDSTRAHKAARSALFFQVATQLLKLNAELIK